MEAQNTLKKPLVPTNDKNKKSDEGSSRVSKRQIAYIILLSTGLLLLGGSAALAMTGTLDGLEQRIFAAINHASLPGWLADRVAEPISNAVYGMIILVAVFLAVPKFRLLAWQYAVAGGGAFVAAFIIERIVNRARPAELDGFDVVWRTAQDVGYGFPSTHVTILAALALTIWPLVTWPWRIFMVALVAVESWSRIFLGMHAPLDVVGGIAVAAVVVGVIHLLPSKIRKIFKIAA